PAVPPAGGRLLVEEAAARSRGGGLPVGGDGTAPVLPGGAGAGAARRSCERRGRFRRAPRRCPPLVPRAAPSARVHRPPSESRLVRLRRTRRRPVCGETAFELAGRRRRSAVLRLGRPLPPRRRRRTPRRSA